MKKLLGAAAIAAACLAASPAVASAAAPIRECGHVNVTSGSPAGVLNLTTRNVACGYARDFSVQVTEHLRGPIDGSHAYYGFECRGEPLGMHKIDIRCVKGADVIRWQIGD